MNSRVILLFGALLVAPAWSQESAPKAPVLTRQSFDRNSDSIKKIVRDAAATQAAIVQVSEEAPIESKAAETVKYVPPEEEPAPAPKSQVPRLHPTPASNGFLSALFEIALDSALGGGSDYSAAESSDRWLRCESRAPLKSTQMGYDTCPAKNQDLPRAP